MTLRDKAEKAKITWGQPGWIQNEIFVSAASPDKILELLDLLGDCANALHDLRGGYLHAHGRGGYVVANVDVAEQARALCERIKEKVDGI